MITIRLRFFSAAAMLMAAATVSAAVSAQYAEWFEGPAKFLMTRDELAAVKTVATDADARAFVELFWARRDPSPATPRNETREQFEARVAWADQNLKEGQTRGALTERGRTLILYGEPKKIERPAPRPTRMDTQNERDTTQNWMDWTYEGGDTNALFNAQRVTIRFIDSMARGTYRLERSSSDLTAAQQRVIQRLIVQPELKAPPVFAAQAAAAPQPAAPAAPPAPPTALTTAELATAVSEFKSATANPYAGKGSVAWGEYVTGRGEYFVPVLLYVPKSVGLAPDQEATFFGVIEDESGNSVAAFEEPVKLHGAKEDVFADRSLALPAGKHRGIFGLAVAGKPVVIASSNLTLAGAIDKDAPAVSPLILSNFVQPMETAQSPTEPFAFGGVKVVPKADKTFRTSDELWYFFELRNPGLGDLLAPTEGTVTGAPAEQKPKVQVRVDVEGKDPEGKPLPKRSAPPREIEAVAMKGVPGHFGVGNAIPLESFKPGDYTITLKVIDTVRKASYTLSDTFKIVP
jgi:GWxTD domain-containing protein